MCISSSEIEEKTLNSSRGGLEDFQLSVIVPVYNVSEYLPQCMESILNQQDDRMEVIIVDDGSKDNSPEICDRYAGLIKNCKVIHQKNGGLSVARNVGIRNSKGKYLFFLDSDDWLVENSIKKMLDSIESGSNPDVFINLLKYYDNDVGNIEECGYSFDNIEENKHPLKIFYNLLHIKGVFLGAQIFVIRRQCVIDNNLFFEPGLFHEDNLWIAQVFMRSAHVVLNDVELFYYRKNRSGSIMYSTSPDKMADQLKIIDLLSTEVDKKDRNCRRVIGYWNSKIYRAVVKKLIFNDIGCYKRTFIKMVEEKKRTFGIYGYKDILPALCINIIGVEKSIKIIKHLKNEYM